MVWIVEMVRGKPNTPSFAEYSCGRSAWEGLLSIARSFGWKPAGAIPDPYAARWAKDYERFFQPSYSPEEWGYCKRISDADALNLAAALKRAAKAVRDGDAVMLERPGPLLLKDHDISAEELLRVNQPPTVLLEEFAEFAAGGGFAFAWDD